VPACLPAESSEGRAGGGDAAVDGDERDGAGPQRDSDVEAEASEPVDAVPGYAGPWPDCDELGWGPSVPLGTEGRRTAPRFHDVSSRLGLTELWGMTASWGDINGDAVPDLFVPGYAAESSWSLTSPEVSFAHTVWINCAGTFQEVDLEPRWPELRSVREANASHIADIDRDGLADLVLVEPEMVHVAFQNADGTFDPVLAVDGYANQPADAPHPSTFVDVVVADLDGDGLLDLYVSNFFGVDPLMQNVGGRSFVDRAFDSPEFVAATRLETYATSAIFGPPGREHPLIYVGNHGEPNWLFRVGEDFELTPLVDDHYPFATMGVDFQHLDGGERTMLGTTDTSALEISFIEEEQLRGEPSCGGTLLLPEEDRCGRAMFGLQGWGLRFEDFDNDGVVDLAMAHGYQSPDADFVSEENTPNFDVQRLVLARIGSWLRDADLPLWTVDNRNTGPHFDGTVFGHYFGVATADFDLDGCVDLLVTPFAQYSNRPRTRLYAQPILVLRNACGYPGDWIGFWMHDDPGALLTVTIDYGDEAPVRRIREVRASAAIACESASEQVHVGLGEGATVMSVEIICRDGRTTIVDGADLEIGQYNDVRHACTSDR
jgi:hypothetical protein